MQPEPLEVAVVGYPGCMALDVVGPSDVFTTASQHAGKPLYEPLFVAKRANERVAAESGIEFVAADSLENRIGRAHTLLISGGDGFRAAMNDRRFIETIASAAAEATRVVSVCTGAFLLAEAGLLDGKRATTHWAHADELADEFPNVEVVPDEIYVSSGSVMTSAGVSAGIDLALAMVSADHGDELARRVARSLVVYLNRSGGQSQFSERLDVSDHSDPGIDLVMASVLADCRRDCSIASLATLAAMSERHFARKFKAATGTTPSRWIQRVRVDAAKELLETSDASLRVVASEAGFRSYDTMRQAFERIVGVTPARYRHTH